MADTSNNTSDEIDLGRLFTMIKGGLLSIFNVFLRFFLYLKRNIFILLGLAVLGIAIGFGLKQISTKKMKTEIIVRPNLESKEYLYDVIDEIQANIWAGDTLFFRKMNVEATDVAGMRILIEPLGNKKNNLENELKYLELLRGLDLSGSISDLVRNEILERNSFNHKITFIYEDALKGQEISKKIMAYVNSNPYFDDLVATYTQNAINRIERDSVIINQIDVLVDKYAANLGNSENSKTEGRIILGAEEQLDIPALLQFKNGLVKDIESKRIELQEQDIAIKIINFGEPQQLKKPFFTKKLVLMPLIFISLFFLWSFLKYLNKEAAKLN